MGNRLTSPHTPGSTSSFLTFGRLFIFGDLLENNKTLASYLQKKLTHHSLYNFGISGGSIHQFLEKILNNSLDSLFTNKDVTILYGGLSDHILRSNYGATDCCFSWGERFITKMKFCTTKETIRIPYYLLATSTSFRALTKSSYFSSSTVSSKEYKNYCTQLKEIKNQIRLRTTGSLRIIGLSYLMPEKLLKQCFESLNIQFINIEDIVSKYESKDLFIENDGHPTALLNQLIAQKITRIIELD
jgi:hypothetical protein